MLVQSIFTCIHSETALVRLFQPHVNTHESMKTHTQLAHNMCTRSLLGHCTEKKAVVLLFCFPAMMQGCTGSNSALPSTMNQSG